MGKETGFGDAAGVIKDQPKEPFIVHCGDCGHEWPAAYLPMEVNKFASITKNARCPVDGSKNIKVGPKK